MGNKNATGLPRPSQSESAAPPGGAYFPHLQRRHQAGRVWLAVFQLSTLVGIIALTALLLNIINSAFGYVAIENKVNPDSLAIDGIPLENLHPLDLTYILRTHVSAGLFRRLAHDKPFEARSQEEIYDLVIEWVVQPRVERSWPLFVSLFHRETVFAEAAEKYPQAQVVFRSWLSPDFLARPQSSRAEFAGVRTAILGSLWTIAITILFAFPVGVGAAIYLEEYASDTWLHRMIQTNINNLAGVPSIIYGILGLAIFVRALESITSGAVFGYVEEAASANGRTILSAGMTLGLLILPIIIINAQEAIRSVPRSLRQASYGLGATKWQTVWHHVLPGALPGILTGTILALSRAIGETAPLVVVGASTFITFDPDGPFSRFTTLPIQIYQWTSRPQDEFRNIAAAAILVLLALLLSMNAAAVLLRNRYGEKGRR